MPYPAHAIPARARTTRGAALRLLELPAREGERRAGRFLHQRTQCELVAAVATRFVQGGDQPVDSGDREIARGEMPATLVAGDLQDLVHGDATDIARGSQLVRLGYDQQPGPLQCARD